MEKKVTTLRMRPTASRRLRMLAAEWDMPIGDVVEGLMDFAESYRHIKDAPYQKRFLGALDLAMLNAGLEAMWDGEVEKAAEQDDSVRGRQMALRAIKRHRREFADALGIVPGVLGETDE